MDERFGIDSDVYNESVEKAELLKELTNIQPMVYEHLGYDSILSNSISDALAYEDLDDLRMAKAAFDSLPTHIKQCLNSDWAPMFRRPDFRELLEHLLNEGIGRRFLKIDEKWNDHLEAVEVSSDVVFELLITDSPVTVYIKEGTSKETGLEFLKKAISEIDESWHRVSKPYQKEDKY